MKPILMVKDHPELEKILQKQEERTKFFKKKNAALMEEVEKARKEFWNEVDAYVVKHKLVKTTKGINFGFHNDVLYEKGECENGGGLLEAIQGLFK